jgi:hypothetical protein
MAAVAASFNGDRTCDARNGPLNDDPLNKDRKYSATSAVFCSFFVVAPTASQVWAN